MAVPSPRTLEQILAESASIYTPQIESIQKQASMIPTQIAEQEKGLAAQQEQAFGNILSGARRRGTGIAFGGIPISEQAQYTASTYMPALANLKQAGIQQQMSLQDAINQIIERQQTAALGQQQYEQQRYDAEQQSLRQAAASQANISQYLSALTQPTSGATQTSLPKKLVGRNFGTGTNSYQFTDYEGTPITAAEYVEIYNASNPSAPIGFRQLLQEMADSGDINAKVALNYVGDDAMFGSAPEAYRSSLEALGATGTYTKPLAQSVFQYTPYEKSAVNAALNIGNKLGLKPRTTGGW